MTALSATKNRKLYIFDVDGTLVNSYPSLSHAWELIFNKKINDKDLDLLDSPTKRKLYYLAYVELEGETRPNPLVIDMLRSAKEEGGTVAVVTGRHTDDNLNVTKQTLKRFEVDYDMIFTNSTTAGASDFKAACARTLASKLGAESVEAYDDVEKALHKMAEALSGLTTFKSHLVKDGIPTDMLRI